MDPEIVSLMVCLYCEGSFPNLDLFAFEKSENGNVKTGMLYCAKCHRFYPIRSKILYFLPDTKRNIEEERRSLEKYKEQIPKEVISEIWP